MGEYEPEDSRNVTGANANAGGRPQAGGSFERQGEQRWAGDGQQSQSQDGSGQQQGGFSSDTGQQSQLEGEQSDWSSQIREHMEVIGADGTHVGTVDHIDGHRVKLTKRENDAGHEGGTHSGHHHYLSVGLIADVEGDKVRLSANGDVAWGMLEEE